MLVDVGVNLLNGQFRRDRDAVVQRARQAGVDDMLIIATDLDSSMQAIELGGVLGMRCTAGVHPHDAAAVTPGWQDQLRQLATEPRVCAVGETGLDFNRNFSPPTVQREVFAAQIQIAQQVDKPLYVHDRESQGELMQILGTAGLLPPVLVHCFTGTAAELESYLQAGFYIGITGWVTDPQRGAALRDLVTHIPTERLLLETDAPFLKPFNTPEDWPGQHGLGSRYKRRCEPAMLPYVLQMMARLRQQDVAELAAATRANAERLFGMGQPSAQGSIDPGNVIPP